MDNAAEVALIVPANDSIKPTDMKFEPQIISCEYPLNRVPVSAPKDRLLGCATMLGQQKQQQLQRDNVGTAGQAGVSEAVLCTSQAGHVFKLPGYGHSPVATGLTLAGSIACCDCDGAILAAARRDGAVTALSCASVASDTEAFSGEGCASSASLLHPSTAVSTKMDFVVSSISICSQLGRIALAGAERKQHTGVLWLWEYDPSIRPAALEQHCVTETLGGFSHLDSSTIHVLASASSTLLSSAESRVGSLTSPSDVRLDRQANANGAAKGNKATAAAVSGADGGVSSKLPYSHQLPGCTAAVAAVGLDAWIWHCDSNPCQVLTCPDTVLTCSAWSGGTSTSSASGVQLVVGSAAGWLVVLDLARQEMEDNLVGTSSAVCYSVSLT
jgi:hypothetical protein